MTNEQAVIAYFDYQADNLEPLLEVGDLLERAIAEATVGEFDGHEISTDLKDGTFYMYAPSAEALFAVVRPILAAANCLGTVRVTLRFNYTDETPERSEIITK